MAANQSSGDPFGRRVWRRRAQALEHARSAAAALRILLQRVDDPISARVAGVEAHIAESERVAIQRGGGRIEPRKRFRRPDSGGNPVRERRRPLNWLYLDESGSPHPAAGRTQDAWFALAGVSMSLEQSRIYEDAADQVKRAFFGQTDLTLHEPDMRRNERMFNLGDDQRRQHAFRGAVDELVLSTEFVAFAVGIRKREYGALSGDSDPYLPVGVYDAAMQLLLERYVDFLHNHGDDPRGRVTLEAQGAREDAEHQRSYVELLLNGTQWVPEGAFRSYLETGVRFKGKVGSHPLELSDMLARDVFEWIRSDCLLAPHRWPIFEQKLYGRGDLRSGKFGLKVFPAGEIADQIEAHREQARIRLRRP